MVITVSGARRLCRLSAVALLSCCLGSAVAQAGTRQVPDLLDLPARVDARAQHGLQLAVARAGDRLVAVGVRGNVVLSDDAGHSWRQARSVPVSVALTSVQFVSASEGWAVGHGGIVLHSADGGETWRRQLDGRQAAALVLDEARARLAAGEERAARAVRDAERMVEEGPDKPLLGVYFVDAQRGYVVGAYGLAFATADGGKSWQSITGLIPNPRGKHLYQVQVEGDDVLIAGEQGALFRSTDGGTQFAALQTPYAGTFFGAVLVDHERLLAFGLRGNAWLTEDAGLTWTQVPIDQEITLTTGARLPDGSVVLADESGRLLRSTDGARSFRALPLPAATGLTGFALAADGALVVAGARGLARVEQNRILAEAKQ